MDSRFNKGHDRIHNLFVYGTLLKGLERNFALDDAQQIGGGTIRARLYDLGPYPGIKPGDAQVRGEVYSVSDDTLELIDHIHIKSSPGSGDAALNTKPDTGQSEHCQ